jgi:nitrite reductase/ring-hydroxylating ferredoxin subunit
MYIRNQWYVASWDHEIDRAPFARTICGEQIMLYRKFDRSVVALHDACPHRLLPLSMGIKEGDNVRCRYHGLLINSDGQAIEMPVRTERGQQRRFNGRTRCSVESARRSRSASGGCRCHADDNKRQHQQPDPDDCRESGRLYPRNKPVNSERHLEAGGMQRVHDRPQPYLD